MLGSIPLERVVRVRVGVGVFRVEIWSWTRARLRKREQTPQLFGKVLRQGRELGSAWGWVSKGLQESVEVQSRLE